MSNQPRRPDLSDAAIFADIDRHPVATTGGDPDGPVLAAVTAALRAMRAANLKPSYGWDQADAEQVWAAALHDVSPAAIIVTGGEWARAEGAEFPELGEFEAVARSTERKMSNPPAPERDWDDECPECGDAEQEGWVYMTDPTEGGIQDRRPCSQCRATQYEMHQRGHNQPNGGTCRCGHPSCPDTIRRKRRKAAMA